MGYTHYWNHKHTINKLDWSRLQQTVKKIVGASDAPVLDLEIKTEVIRFDGDCETFSLTRSPQPFEFCKTNRAPYDEIVVAVLLAAANYGVQFSSDGGAADLEDGAALYARAILYKD